LCGITPTPDNEAVAKTALGAENTVTWSYHKDAVALVTKLKEEKWNILALEEDPRSIALNTHHFTATTLKQPTLLILGNEVTGVDPGLLDLCHQILYIPMRGEKKSFNVAMAFSIAAYQLQK
jgi:tRNA G18 (ribose-2'-O)-methylase SpoU